MTQLHKEVDVVVIGVGAAGSIVAKELAAAGYTVVGLERGHARYTVPEFQSPAIHDELRFRPHRSCFKHFLNRMFSHRLGWTGRESLNRFHARLPVGNGRQIQPVRPCFDPAGHGANGISLTM